MEYTISLATLADYEGFLALHRRYHTDYISPEDRADGFVTTNFTQDQLNALIDKEKGVLVAKDKDGKIVGYVTCASWEFWSQWPFFQHMINHLGEYALHDETFTVANSYQYGPILIAKEVRGAGLFEKLFTASLAQMANRYPNMITFVNKINPRSYAAHTKKAGMTTCGDFQFNNNNYYFLACKTK